MKRDKERSWEFISTDDNQYKSIETVLRFLNTFCHTGYVDLRRLGIIFRVGMPVTDEMQTEPKAGINFYLFNLAVRNIAVPASFVRGTRASRLDHTHLCPLHSGEQLPAGLPVPTSCLAVSEEVSDHTA